MNFYIWVAIMTSILKLLINYVVNWLLCQVIKWQEKVAWQEVFMTLDAQNWSLWK